MGSKKKVSSAKSWTLAGEPVYSIALTPTEERVFKETVSRFRETALFMREESDRFARAGAIAKAGEQAARASVGFFCKYFDGKYQRVDIVKALATAATLPSPSAERLSTSPCFLLGAALWLLDYVKNHDLEDKFYPLLPDELDDEIGFVTPTVDDLRHTLDEMLGVIAVFMKRKTSSRQAFRKLWGLVDKETAGSIKSAFKDAVLDYLDRFLEVSTRVTPSTPHDGGAPSVLANPNAPKRDWLDEPEFPMASPAKEQPGLWFLTHTALLIGASPETIRETLYYRRSADLMEGFRIQDPYAICAACLLLERDGDVLTDLNMLTAAVVLCAERRLPWGADESFTFARPFEKGSPDHSLLYPFSPNENTEEEYLPDADIEEGERLSEGQLFYLATGYALPRDQVPSGRLREWFIEQGLPETRAEALSWGAWFASYVDELRARRLVTPFDSDGFEDYIKSLEEDLLELDKESKDEDSAVRVEELARQLKESRRILHDADVRARQLQEQLRAVEEDALRDKAELSQLRETLFELRSREGTPEEKAEAEIAFPWRGERRIVAFGGHDTWRKAIRPMLPDVRFFDREMLPDINVVKSADVVWIQTNAISHKFYYRIIDTARKENIPVRYFGSASARKCAEQLAVNEMASAD